MEQLRRLMGRDFELPRLELVEHELLRAVVVEMPIALTAVDRAGTVLLWNPAAERLLGWREDETVGRPMHFLDSARSRQFQELLRRTFEGGEVLVDFATQRRHRDGHSVPVLLSTAPLRDEQGRVTACLGTYKDISTRRLLETQLRRQSQHDELTGLYNRRGFVERLSRPSEFSDRDATVLSLDLDGFKETNDSLGHSTGDQLLQAFAQRLKGSVRPGDVVARVGGDEFLVVLRAIPRGSVEAAVRRLFERLGDRYRVEGRELQARVTGGVARHRPGTDIEDAIREADIALYQAKQSSRGSYQVSDKGMRQAFLQRIDLSSRLAEAADLGELRLHFQPLVTAAAARVVGVEALVRWAPPNRRMVPPDRFIPLAEETGSITAIGGWVLEQACASLRAWELQDDLAANLTVAVNLSYVQLRDPALVDRVARLLDDNELEPARLCLEVTESALSADPQAEAAILRGLRQLGVHLALDDFGTGNSSLTALRQFPFDFLKIDRSFVRGVGTLDEDGAIVAATIALGRALNLTTVAEGVETEAQAEFLASQGCDLLQGYLFSRPMAMEQLRHRPFGPHLRALSRTSDNSADQDSRAG